MFYKIVESETPHGLQDKVNSSIEAGFVPVGGVTVVTNPAVIKYTFLQAMIDKSEDKKKKGA